MPSLVLIKPDGVTEGRIGEIITMLEQDSVILNMHMFRPSLKLLEAHYKDHNKKVFYLELIRAMMMGPLISIQMVGDCNRIRALCLAYRTRCLGDYVGPKNLVHASDSDEAAVREIKLWFSNAN